MVLQSALWTSLFDFPSWLFFIKYLLSCLFIWWSFFHFSGFSWVLVFPFFRPVFPLWSYILNVNLKCVLMQFLTQILLLHIWLIPGFTYQFRSAPSLHPPTPVTPTISGQSDPMWLRFYLASHSLRANSRLLYWSHNKQTNKKRLQPTGVAGLTGLRNDHGKPWPLAVFP